MKFLDSIKIVFLLPVCLGLAACGGGGSGGDDSLASSSTGPASSGTASSLLSAIPSAPTPSSETDWAAGSVAHTFDADRASRIRNSAPFIGVDADLKDGGLNQSHPYELIRLDLALSGGWTGLGQRVAVVDDGFRTTHVEFSGADIATYGDVSIAGGSSHGTHVAALIAGDAQGEMMGVAPDADLHLTSYLTDGTRSSIDLSKLAAATDEAAGLGAVAQNNSWGVLNRLSGDDLRVSEVRNYTTINGGSVAEAYAHLVGGTAAGWQGYFDALENFQTAGVIVWAMSNDETLPENDASSALPLLVDGLDHGWIAVGNGQFSVDSNNEITNARRLSAACGDMAHSCLFADGTTRSAAAAGDMSYGLGTGSSFAAPQVSGALAIMAQAFPSLTPQEWRLRLLASAYSDFADFSTDGTVLLGGAVSKAFSDEWGMGVLDVAAALSPIDEMSVVNGRDLATGERADISETVLVAGAAYGDAARRALAKVDIAVFDALNAPFAVPGDAFAVSAPIDLTSAAALPVIGGSTLSNSIASAGYDRFSASLATKSGAYSVTARALGGQETLAATRGLGSAAAQVGALAPLSNDMATLVGRYDAGPIAFEQFGFFGAHASVENGTIGGVGAAVSVSGGPARIKASVMRAYEAGGVLGLSGRGGFAAPGNAVIDSVSLSGELEIGGGIGLFAGVESGTAGASEGGRFSEMGAIAFSSFQLGLTSRGVIAENDRLTLAVSQPVRIDAGSAVVTLPAGRTLGGEITTAAHRLDVAPEGRQLDFGLNYSFAPSQDSTLSLGAVLSTDSGHVAGETGAAFAAQFTQRF